MYNFTIINIILRQPYNRKMERIISEMLIKFINGAADPSVYSSLMNDAHLASTEHPQGNYIWNPII